MRVAVDPDVMGGVPCFAGTRVPVAAIAALLDAGHDIDELTADFPTLTRADIRDAAWFKSSRSGSGNDQCVEVRLTTDEIGVRDSKARTSGTLHLTPTAWTTFTAAVKTDRM